MTAAKGGVAATVSPPQPVDLLSFPSVAKRLDCSRSHVYNPVATGKLRAADIAASGDRPKTRVRSDDLDEYIERQTRKAGA